MTVALPDGGNRLNLRLALEKAFPWTRVRLESGAVEADLRLKPLATILAADDVARLQRFGRTRGSKAAATIEAPADKDARRAVHTTLAAAFRACCERCGHQRHRANAVRGRLASLASNRHAVEATP